MFGTFLCNSGRERVEARVVDVTAQVWHLLRAPAYTNHLYDPHHHEQVYYDRFYVFMLRVCFDNCTLGSLVALVYSSREQFLMYYYYVPQIHKSSFAGAMAGLQRAIDAGVGEHVRRRARRDARRSRRS